MKFGRVVGASLFSAALTGCVDMNDAVQLATAGVAVAEVAQAARTGSSGAANASYAVPSTSGGGYSQRGAFDDCARVYANVSPQLMRECQQRASNMGSLQ